MEQWYAYLEDRKTGSMEALAGCDNGEFEKHINMNHGPTRLNASGAFGFSPDKLYIDLVDSTLLAYLGSILRCKFISDDDNDIELVTKEEFNTRFDEHFQCFTDESYNTVIKREKLTISKMISLEMLSVLEIFTRK